MNKYILIILIVATQSPLFTQISQGGTPYSISHGLNRSGVPTFTLPPVNVDSLLAADELEPPDTPPRFAFAQEADINLNNSGLWEDLGNGDRLWRMKISSPGAFSLNITFGQFWLPTGAVLFIYTPDNNYIKGAFSEINNKSSGRFFTLPVPGQECYLELFIPSGSTGELIEIEYVAHDYRNFFGFGQSALCNENVICRSAWADQARSVGLIINNSGQRSGTGALINNLGNDGKAYFLSAHHIWAFPDVIPDRDGWLNWGFIFNYQSPVCTENIDGLIEDQITGAMLRAKYLSSDFLLLEIGVDENGTEIEIPDDYNIFYSGWSREEDEKPNAVCIHHPANDVKKISFDSDPVLQGGPLYNIDHWFVDDWDIGRTQSGSSGSPLFDSNHRIIGQNHIRDDSNCDPCEPHVGAYFGGIFASWETGDGTDSEKQLKNWLDPLDNDVMTCDGMNWDGTIMTYPQILLTNTSTEIPGENLGGEFTLYNHNGFEFRNIQSGSGITILEDYPYTARTINYELSVYTHLQWNESDDYLLNYYIYEIQDADISAVFGLQFPVSISADPCDAEIQIHSPWYIENPSADPEDWIQPDEFRPLSEVFPNTQEVFLEIAVVAGEPYYLLQAPETHHASEDEIYIFTSWSGTNVTDLVTDQLQTPVVFYSDAEVTANYDIIPDLPEGASSPPTGLSVSGATGNPVLTWTHVNDDDRSHYNIWVKYTTFGDPGFWHARGTVTTNSWTDTNVGTGGSIPDRAYYKITVEDYFTNVSTYSNQVSIRGDVNYWPIRENAEFAEGDIDIPDKFDLTPAYPNPFNPVFNLSYSIPEYGKVSLVVYDMMGKEVTHLVNTYKEAGYYKIQWDATSHASGVYIVKLVTRDFTATQKVALVK